MAIPNDRRTMPYRNDILLYQNTLQILTLILKRPSVKLALDKYLWIWDIHKHLHPILDYKYISHMHIDLFRDRRKLYLRLCKNKISLRIIIQANTKVRIVSQIT